ncbi:hypothetical protein [Alcanivorax sp.]|uniref:hypothetical protein n=1 Tax=Alcanivorax sp. TaxID=1872427 RepID=UPI0026248D7F|nr:hypothetical protein [Alcanivorax sp.]
MHIPPPDNSGKVAVTALLVLALVVATTLLLQTWVDRRNSHTATAGTSAISPPPATAEPAPTMDSEKAADVRRQQRQAEDAALASVGQQEFDAPPQSRPDFVSPLEWQVLQQVSRNHDQPEQELTRLVNRLRFAKLRELWEAEVETGNDEQRRLLGNQLLEDLPSRVKNREMAPAQAQQLQASILEALIDDPQQRRQRAAEEARRLGITFEIESAG